MKEATKTTKVKREFEGGNYEMARENWGPPPKTCEFNPTGKGGKKGSFTPLQRAAVQGTEGYDVEKAFHPDSEAYKWCRAGHVLRECDYSDNVWMFNRKNQHDEWSVSSVAIATAENGYGKYFSGKAVSYGDSHAQVITVRYT